ncbi:MAG: GNAT family N-acetyltransferase [Bacteroidota bacterium]
MEFKIRPWKKTDKESLVRHANNWNISKNMTDLFPYPFTLEKADSFIEMASTEKASYFFAIEVNHQAVGGIGLHPQTDIQRMNAELGYWLSEEYWGNGIIPKAIVEIVEYGFKQFEINRIFARPFGTNIASQKVLEKAGFVLEATIKNGLIKDGVLVDELIYAVRK